MKKLVLLLVLLMGGLSTQISDAQVSLKVNIASQPIWGPVGYDHVEYYYLPDIEAYYYVPRHKYYFMQNGGWKSGSTLPYRFSDYDVYNSRKVVVNEKKPYLRHNETKAKYGAMNDRTNYQAIRDSHEPRYFENKNHPEHSKWKEYHKNSRRQEKQNLGSK